MDFITWEPIYGRTPDDFGFDRTGNEHARDVLADPVKPFDRDRLNWAGATVAACRAAPTLDTELDRFDDPDVDMVVAASTAADTVRDTGFDLDLMVTDLDKSPGTAVEPAESGASVAAHAHGDGLPAVHEWAPQLDADHTFETAQAVPVDLVVNWGGFTGGDQMTSIAGEPGAKRLVFIGWDFGNPTVNAMKARKLRWAERLLR